MTLFNLNTAHLKTVLPRDALASVVVFLVALPLCMGIAIASGMPPAKGLITGIIGGLVVGWIAGAPLQVSGPAAGLAVLVYELVQTHGAAILGPVLLLAGVLQFFAGRFKLGGWFRVTAPAVVYGMLAGIGILIVLSQIHVMFDTQPEASGLSNLVAFPETVTQALPMLGGGGGLTAALVGLLTIFTMLLWDRFKPHALRFLPSALIAVTLATGASLLLSLNIDRVEVPANLTDAIDWLQPAQLMDLAQPDILIAAIALAFIASAETLLSAAAVDRMHTGARADLDKELSAQGIGNMLCGLVGALPMTGVIVRSSANVQARAQTRLSAVLHGAWLLAFIVILPQILQSIPIASLAGVLVYTGCKLVNVEALKGLRRYGRMPIAIYTATMLGIVMVDLLTGVLLGFLLTLVKLAWKASRLKVKIIAASTDGTTPDQTELRLIGTATFLNAPKLASALETLPHDTQLHVPMRQLTYIDHACIELLEDWGRAAAQQGGALFIEPKALERRQEGRLDKRLGFSPTQ